MQWKFFYTLKPIIPRWLQLLIRRSIVRRRRKTFHHVWPINPKATSTPIGWAGWPEGKQFALILSHDVDTQKGHDACHQLAAIEKSLGFQSSFNFVPERYRNSEALRDRLRQDGFGVGIHGLKHDGKLFRRFNLFKRRAEKINHYLAQWQTRGFSSPSMHHNLNWMHLLDIDYSTSTFDTDPFEPQPDAVDTIFPFWVENQQTGRGFVELPYTLPQDFTLFILMGERTNTIWKKKLDWLADRGGMALVNTHSDYMNFDGSPPGPEEYPVRYYIEFLEYIKKRYADCYYHARSEDVAAALRPVLRSHPLHRAMAA